MENCAKIAFCGPFSHACVRALLGCKAEMLGLKRRAKVVGGTWH